MKDLFCINIKEPLETNILEIFQRGGSVYTLVKLEIAILIAICFIFIGAVYEL